MALITEFQEITADSNRLHGPVLCGWRRFTADDGRTILQLDTYGSPHRKIPNKVSQSIQLDQEAAKALMQLITDTFGEL